MGCEVWIWGFGLWVDVLVFGLWVIRFGCEARCGLMVYNDGLGTGI